jgi:hypothetical protein
VEVNLFFSVKAFVSKNRTVGNWCAAFFEQNEMI